MNGAFVVEQSTEELESKLAELEQIIPSISGVHNTFWKTTPQCSVLLKDTPAPKPVKITSAAKRFTPDGPFYLDSIFLHTDSPEKLNNSLTITIKPLNKPAQQLTINSSPNLKFAYVYLRNFCEWFEIHSDSKIFKPKLTKISIYGADTAQLLDLSDDIRAVIDLKSGIAKYKETSKAENEELSSKTKKLQSDYDEIISQVTIEEEIHKETVIKISALNVTLHEEATKLDQIKWELEQSQKSITQAENNLEQLKVESSSLNQKISELNTELKKLTTDKNLISDEYGPYVSEGKSQAVIYVCIVTLPLLAIIFSVYELYVGASKLLGVNNGSTTEVIGSFVLRIPFAAVFGLAIYYSWRLTSAIIQKIFTIHSDRLTLAKLLVLAREAVHSSGRSLDLTPEFIFQEQLKLKVEVLKSHLSKDLGNDFHYNPVQSTKQNKPPNPGDAVNDTTVDDETAGCRI